MNSSEIILYIIENEGLNRNSFANSIGVDYKQVCDIINGDTKSITKKFAEKILHAFPQYNRVWLLTGEGNKFAEKSNQTSMQMPSVPTLDVKEEGGAVIPSLLSIIKEQGEALKDIALNNDKQRLEEQAHLLNEIQGLKEALESQQKAFKIFCQKLDDLISQSNLPKQKKVS